MKEKKKNPVNHLVNDVACTILGTGLYIIGVFGCLSIGVIVPSMALATYICYGLVGVCLGSIAAIILREDIKEYKNFKSNQKTYYEHFPITKVEYEKKPRYQVDREIGCKVEDFYKEPSSYPTNIVYEKEDKEVQEQEKVVLAKKYRS